MNVRLQLVFREWLLGSDFTCRGNYDGVPSADGARRLPADGSRAIPVEKDGQTGHLLRLFCGIVVQIGTEPPLYLSNTHAFALVVVGDLVAVDFTEAEISGFRMRKIESAHA